MATTSVLSQVSDAIADTVSQAASSVVQVQGGRRPVSGLVFNDAAVLTTVRAIRREEGLAIRTHDGRTIEAELAGWDPATELAVLRAADLKGTALSQAATRARVGHLVVALARSWSNALTASAGIVAVIGGPLRTGRHHVIEEVLRTTAPMHDGFAGGPLLDMTGAVLGISTAATIRGLAVVIPASIAWKTAADLLAHGSPRRGFVGVAGQQVRLTGRQREQAQQETALLVIGVTPDSPAERAGVLVGDVIVEFDGKPVRSAEDLLDLLHGRQAGTAATLRVLRGDQRYELAVTIGERSR
ncbi:MAG TPA: trypsin-like peptidase domain-containing protein [Vicinamibacterales bacterium]|nr:trypsin-like peptidase domain-containing protein [Vicinamibacterales bacterium]